MSKSHCRGGVSEHPLDRLDVRAKPDTGPGWPRKRFLTLTLSRWAAAPASHRLAWRRNDADLAADIQHVVHDPQAAHAVVSEL